MSHVLQEHDFEDAELFYELATPRGASLVAGPAATGHAIVSWIANTRQVSRDTATRWALQIMREGGLRHVYDDSPFRDDQTLYRIA